MVQKILRVGKPVAAKGEDPCKLVQSLCEGRQKTSIGHERGERPIGVAAADLQSRKVSQHYAFVLAERNAVSQADPERRHTRQAQPFDRVAEACLHTRQIRGQAPGMPMRRESTWRRIRPEDVADAP
jgi:hypothetical protein